MIDTLGDLDRKHANVSAIFNHIQNVEKSSNDILHSVPDNGNVCVIKVKYSLNESIRRLKELCDLCIAENLDTVNTSILNVKKLIRTIENQFPFDKYLSYSLQENQNECLNETLSSVQIEIDAVKPQAAECKSMFLH